MARGRWLASYKSKKKETEPWAWWLTQKRRRCRSETTSRPGVYFHALLTDGVPEVCFERLAEAGYKMIIDLRTLEEDRALDEQEVVESAGMEYVNILVGHEDVENETFERFRELMKDPERRPVLVHCSSASRVGALLIPYFVLDEGKNTDEVVEMASEVGLKSDELKQAALRYVEHWSD